MAEPQEQFRYNSQSEKTLVTKAFMMNREKKRTHFVRDIVLRACKRLIKKR